MEQKMAGAEIGYNFMGEQSEVRGATCPQIIARPHEHEMDAVPISDVQYSTSTISGWNGW